jgi:hypothetical protein
MVEAGAFLQVDNFDK